MSGQAIGPIGWAVVGSSEFALDYVVPAIRSQPDCAVRAIVSRDPARVCDRLGDDGDGITITADLDDLPGLGADVVHLVVPNLLHRPMTLRSFALGCHVLVEKPMALSVNEAREMAAAAATANRLLAVGSCMAWSPAVTRAGDLLRAGVLGPAQHAGITAGFDTGEHRGWRQVTSTAGGGGVLNDLGAHAIDAVIRLFGDVGQVTASLRTTLPRHESDDSASLMLRHVTGVTSHLELAFTHGCNQLSVTGTDGLLISREWLGRRFAGDLVRYPDQADASRFGEVAAGAVDELRDAPVTDVLALQAAEIAAAVRAGDAPAHADVATALKVMTVIDAAIRSSASQRVVSLGEASGVSRG
jgi:1,5-anhydro-D-fructose reductase (1,5-anhydro-D-mannitol-forming)